MNLSVLNVQQRISAVAILVVFISAFLPWASLWNHSILGVQGDGIITLLLAVIGAGVFLLGNDFLFSAMIPRKIADITLVVLSGLTALIALISTVNIGSFASIGVYFTLFGAIAWVVGAVWHLVAMLNATKAHSMPQNAAPQNFGPPAAAYPAAPSSPAPHSPAQDSPAPTDQQNLPPQESGQSASPAPETSVESTVPQPDSAQGEAAQPGPTQGGKPQDGTAQDGGAQRPGGYRPPQRPGQSPDQP